MKGVDFMNNKIRNKIKKNFYEVRMNNKIINKIKALEDKADMVTKAHYIIMQLEFINENNKLSKENELLLKQLGD